MAAFGGDDALGAMMAATLPRSTMSKDQMQSIANGARPKTARPKTARPKKETTPWTKEDVTKLKKACKEVPSTVEKQQRWRQISGLVGRGKRECYDKYKELALGGSVPLTRTMSRALELDILEALVEARACLREVHALMEARRKIERAGTRRAQEEQTPRSKKTPKSRRPCAT